MIKFQEFILGGVWVSDPWILLSMFLNLIGIAIGTLKIIQRQRYNLHIYVWLLVGFSALSCIAGIRCLFVAVCSIAETDNGIGSDILVRAAMSVGALLLASAICDVVLGAALWRNVNRAPPGSGGTGSVRTS